MAKKKIGSKAVARKPSLYGKKGQKAIAQPEAPRAVLPLLAVCEPLDNRVVIEIDIADNKIGSIVLPTAAVDKPQTGTVIRVGPGRMKDGVLTPCVVKLRERVIFAKYAGMSLEGTAVRDGDRYIMMRDDDVLAKLPDGY